MGITDKLAETIAPQIFEKVATDTLDILRQASASDGKGGQKKSAAADTNRYGIPCAYEPKGISVKDVKSGEWSSRQGYLVMLPGVQDGARIDLKTSDRLLIKARGLQPEKLFRIEAIKDYSGVYYEVICELAQ